MCPAQRWLQGATGPQDLTRDRAGLERLVRNEVFRFLRMLANKAYQEIDESFQLERMYPEARWKYTDLSNAMEVYYASHEWIRLDPAARNKGNTSITESQDRSTWEVVQTLVDPAGLNDYQIVFELSLARS